jgi:hypothetical protein
MKKLREYKAELRKNVERDAEKLEVESCSKKS